MRIKKLTNSSAESLKMKLNKEDGILLLKNKKNEHLCLYISKLKNEEKDNINSLRQINEIHSIRYIGNKEILDRISKLQLSWWLNPERSIFCDSDRLVCYYPQSGKVRFENGTSSPTLKVKKKVLIVDDSKTIQKLLKKIINVSSELEVMAVADGPREAREILEKQRPDLITLDIHMPEMNGVEFLKSYLCKSNIPVVMITSVSMAEGPLVMEALSYGAVTYIQKPSIDELDDVLPDIIEKLEEIAQSKVHQISNQTAKNKSELKFKSFDGLIAIGSSTGGTQALQEIFCLLPDEIPPIVVVQHIPAVFSKALADRLDTLCKFKVKEAEDGEMIKSNTIYIAPGGKQFKLVKRGHDRMVVINDDPPVNRFRPSVDYLFNSIVELKEKNLVSLILTGMGKDGAKGLLNLKQAGAKTLAQDEASSVVFGMPKEAIQLGAADKVVALSDMASQIVEEFNRKK